MDSYDFRDVDDYSDPVFCHRLNQFQDLKAAEAEAFNDILRRHLPREVEYWKCDLDGWTFDLADVVLEVRNRANGPIRVTAESSSVGRKFLDSLRIELRYTASQPSEMHLSSIGFAVLLLQLSETCIIWLERWQEHLLRIAHPQRVAGPLWVSDLQIDAFDADTPTAEKERLLARRGTVAPKPYTIEEISGWYSVFDNSSGLDISSIEDTTQHILGKSIEEVCKEITHPRWYHGEYYGRSLFNDDIRILHIEPVLRPDLVLRFLDRKEQIHQDLLQMTYHELRQSVSRRAIRYKSREDTVEGLAQVLAEPSVTFHGAPRHIIESIVRYGFIMPEDEIGKTGRALDTSRGASFGVGVYSTPDPYTAMAYGQWRDGTLGAERSGAFNAHHARGNKIIVCATLMGRAATVTRGETRRTHGPYIDLAHSHVSPDQKEYIVFSSAQIIPCYVLHVADHPDMVDKDRMSVHQTMKLSQAALRSAEYTAEEKDYDRHGNEIRWPGYEAKKKRAIRAGAAKHFPYGFGPATGANFVIEDVADVSDDEEVYGEFQYQRIEQGTEIRENIKAPGTNWLDQYQMARKTNTEVLF